jgi:hypothetical protein
MIFSALAELTEQEFQQAIGSAENQWSGPSIALSRVKCFSIISMGYEQARNAASQPSRVIGKPLQYPQPNRSKFT